MTKKLFIGSLAYATTDDSLQTHFSTIGPVASAKVVLDRDNNNRSRGFGFVEFENDDDADRAVKELDQSELDGRTINVSEARPREDRPRRDFNNRGNGGGGGSFRQRSW